MPSGSSAATASCDGKRATIVGTPGDDVIVGKAGNDVIYGGGGNDRISGGPNGNDTICGGPGDDKIDGEGGGDWAWRLPSRSLPVQRYRNWR